MFHSFVQCKRKTIVQIWLYHEHFNIYILQLGGDFNVCRYSFCAASWEELLLQMRTAKVQASLLIRAVAPEPMLSTHVVE